MFLDGVVKEGAMDLESGGQIIGHKKAASVSEFDTAGSSLNGHISIGIKPWGSFALEDVRHKIYARGVEHFR